MSTYDRVMMTLVCLGGMAYMFHWGYFHFKTTEDGEITISKEMEVILPGPEVKTVLIPKCAAGAYDRSFEGTWVDDILIMWEYDRDEVNRNNKHYYTFGKLEINYHPDLITPTVRFYSGHDGLIMNRQEKKFLIKLFRCEIAPYLNDRAIEEQAVLRKKGLKLK